MNFGAMWKNLTNTFGTNAGAWTSAAQSAMSGLMSRARAATWVVGRTNIGHGARRRFNHWARIAQSIARKTMTRVRAATWVVGRTGPSVPNPFKAIGQGLNNWRSQGRDKLDPWLLQQFLPSQHGFFGKAGGAIGYTGGALFGGPGGGAIGQGAGTVVGNFVEKLKDAVVQAREFAVALKESNRRFIYYNADISMSYVESDIAEMRRNFSIARAIAPNVTSLNQQVTTYQQTIMPWDIFRAKLSYETKGAGLGAAQYLAEVASPAVSYLNSVMDRISPNGNTGYSLGQKLMRASLQAAYSSIPLIGPILGLLTGTGMLPGLLPGIPNANPPGLNKGDPIGPWEKLMNNPNAILPRDAQFHQNPFVFRLKPGMRF